MSLKLRLTLLSSLLMFATLTLVGWVSYNFVANAFEQQLDAALEDRANEVLDTVAGMGQPFFTDPNLRIAESTHNQTVRVDVQILDSHGNLRYSSDPLGRPLLPIDLAQVQVALGGGVGIVDGANSAHTAMHIRYQPLPSSDPNLTDVLEVGTPLTATDNALTLMRVVLVVATLLTSALVGLGVWVAATRTLAAVARVTSTARSIELSNRISARIPEGAGAGDDEMDRLVRTFNNMLDRISASFETQRQFVADSSHELRSPLTVIRGNLEILRRTHDPAERVAIERLIEEEAARMSRMVDNLLFLAQIEDVESGKTERDRRPVELDSLLLTVYQQARSLTSRHTIQLGDEDAITITGDRDQLQQLLLNLVDNAIKYTPAGGTIVLSLRGEPEWAVLEVRDTGIGIPPEDLPHIFDRFFRVDRARSRRIGGAGLGLSIVQRITTGHQGIVSVESEVGQGTTFRVRLPRTEKVSLLTADREAHRPNPLRAAS